MRFRCLLWRFWHFTALIFDMIKKNDELILKITDVTNLGYGVAKYNGETVFVRSSVTGEVVKAVIIKKYPSYAIAVLKELITASDVRCDNDCAVFPACGGCAYRHIRYDYELTLKKQYVKACFQKEGIDIDVADVIHASEYHYRNKVQYPVSKGKDGRLFLGFFSEYSHRVVSSEGCLTESLCFSHVKQVITELINEFSYSAYDEQSGCGLLRHVFLRCNKRGDVHVCFVINGAALPHMNTFAERLTSLCSEITGVSVNINTDKTNVVLGDKTVNICGSPFLLDEMCGKSFEIDPKSFWQINRNTAEMMYQKGKELLDLRTEQVLLDLYCGIGSIGLSIADIDSSLVGVDIVPEAIEDAKHNAKRNGFSKAQFVCGDADIGFTACHDTFGRIDAAIVDPPRKGLSDKVINDIAASCIDSLLYISCNPATLARDVKKLFSKGFTSNIVYPFDMFPRTGHVETVVMLKR